MQKCNGCQWHTADIKLVCKTCNKVFAQGEHPLPPKSHQPQENSPNRGNKVEKVSQSPFEPKQAQIANKGQYFLIWGVPVAQGRPKFYRKGNFVGVYDPVKSKNWKAEIKRQVILQKPMLHDGAVGIKLHFALPMPKTLPKKVIYHTKKPDLDNLIKAVKDALNGICYKDDSQITQIFAKKKYCESPFVAINIFDLPLEIVDTST